MKPRILIVTAFLIGCGGSLSDEQRKRLHEGMDKQKIVKLSDSEIMSASLDQGREVFDVLDKLKFDSSKVDSVARKYNVKIRWITPGANNALEVENQLIEAYVVGAETGSTQDNVQELHGPNSVEFDSLLYSRPVVTPMPDGAVNVEGVWNIYIAKKNIILSAAQKQ
ncbi:MAG TPA: hypothetical protein VK589_17740 [Chryseolinea sp.]|nr:hypothetical protein [Chryseolinea sp.]